MGIFSPLDENFFSTRGEFFLMLLKMMRKINELFVIGRLR